MDEPFNTLAPNIIVNAESEFIPQQSDFEQNRYVFAYTIKIENKSEKPYQLLSRHWVIQDANMKVEEVAGDGVVGETPIIEPGGYFSYTSGAVLETDMGTMEGRYFFTSPNESSKQDSNSEFEVLIPKFLLTVPRVVH